jgi:pentatricopeptide repeat protein
MCNPSLPTALLCLHNWPDRRQIWLLQTLIAAYGMAGRPEAAEAVFGAMAKVGYSPRDYAYCGLIAAYRCLTRPPPADGYSLKIPHMLRPAICRL